MVANDGDGRHRSTCITAPEADRSDRFALLLFATFVTSGDSGDTSAELIAYAKDNDAEIWALQIVALICPLLIGFFIASLCMRLHAANDPLWAPTLLGGTLFIAFLATGFTIWASPLIENETLTDAGAQAYLMYDDVGWVLLGLSGISIGVAIISVSLAALRHGWVPKWAGWISFALGVLSSATVVFVGMFGGRLIWFLAAGVVLLRTRGERPQPAVPADAGPPQPAVH